MLTVQYLPILCVELRAGRIWFGILSLGEEEIDWMSCMAGSSTIRDAGRGLQALNCRMSDMGLGERSPRE